MKNRKLNYKIRKKSSPFTGDLQLNDNHCVTQNGPGTAPGSQGVFRGKGVGSKWAPGNLLFLSWCCLAQLPGQVLNFLLVGKFKQMSFEIKRFVYSVSKLLTT
jgi:hypothetical protein